MFRRFVTLALIFVPASSAQQFPASSMQVRDGQVTAIYGPPRAEPVISAAPYSADELQEYTPPGETVPSRSGIIGHFARDSQGRTRTSRAFKAAPFWLTEIFDPIAGAGILLDEQAKVAHRMVVQPAPAPHQPVAPRSEVSSQSLGTRSIEGWIAEGTRVSGILTIETWKSPELKIDLVTRSSNGYGSRLINLSRAEPDPALFRPPADYRVVDETAPFSMTVRTR
jgi:hypothetical protein